MRRTFYCGRAPLPPPRARGHGLQNAVSFSLRRLRLLNLIAIRLSWFYRPSSPDPGTGGDIAAQADQVAKAGGIGILVINTTAHTTTVRTTLGNSTDKTFPIHVG